MVLAGGHGDNVLPIAEGQNGDLGACHAFLDDHRSARGAEFATLHHVPNGGLGLRHGLGYNHALAQGQTVRLDHDGRALSVKIG